MDKERRFFPTILLIILLMLLACSLSNVPLDLPASSEDSCPYTASRQAEVEARNVERIHVLARAGDLQITGQDDTIKVVVNGTACASAESLLDSITLTAKQQGSEIIIRANLPPPSPSQITNLNLSLEVPHDIPLDIEDTGGPLVVSQQHAPVHLVDGSGSIELQTIDGDVTIAQDGAGPITMRQIKGQITIKQDGAGEINIEQAGQTITIDDDGGGDINVHTVNGSVTIGHDGSGDIVVTGVQGGVNIGHDGAGSIDVSNVTGDFVLGSDGSGDVSYTNIGGEVSVPQ